MKRENLSTTIKLSYISTNICFEGKKIPIWRESQRVEWYLSADLTHLPQTSTFVPFLFLHISKQSRLIPSIRLATVLNLGETGVEQEERSCLHRDNHSEYQRTCGAFLPVTHIWCVSLTGWLQAPFLEFPCPSKKFYSTGGFGQVFLGVICFWGCTEQHVNRHSEKRDKLWSGLKATLQRYWKCSHLDI